METLSNKLQPLGKRSILLELDKGAINGLNKMPIDIFDGIFLDKVNNNALILCVDIRNFSEFLCVNTDDSVFKLIKEFTVNLLSCINQFGYGCSFYKLMGDGALVIWDETNEKSVSEALSIYNSYTEFLAEELFKPFGDLGLSGALVEERVYKYEISAEVSQLKYRDYVGYGINLAYRLQVLTGFDTLILNERLANKGMIPFEIENSKNTLKQLGILKGLKEEDRQRVFLYKK